MFLPRRPLPSLRAVVGLGNPGAPYQATRHNIGARVVQEWAAQARLSLKASRSLQSLIAQGKLGNDDAYLLVLPQTFMNLSGVAVKAVARRKGLTLSRLLVIHDDIALPLGTLRFKDGGGDGGHNGVGSLISHLGTADFIRLRIGIGPRPQGLDLSDFVLSRFTRVEEPAVRRAAQEAQEALTLWLSGGTVAGMNRYNKKQDVSEGIGNRHSEERT